MCGEKDELMILFITEVKVDSAELIDTDWYETLSTGSTQVKFKLDTGAQTDLLPTKVSM